LGVWQVEDPKVGKEDSLRWSVVREKDSGERIQGNAIVAVNVPSCSIVQDEETIM
jgi:hypothetical protein